MFPQIRVIFLRPPPPRFDPEDRSYKSCCGTVAAPTAAVVVGVVQALLAGLSLAASATELALGGFGMSTFTLVVDVVLAVVTILTIGVMFFGVKEGREGLVIPYLVVQALCLVVLGIAIVLSLIGMAVGGTAAAILTGRGGEEPVGNVTELPGGPSLDHTPDPAGIVAEDVEPGGWAGLALTALLGITLAFLVIFFLVELWFFSVVLACYRFLRDRRLAEARGPDPFDAATVTLPLVSPQLPYVDDELDAAGKGAT